MFSFCVCVCGMAKGQPKGEYFLKDSSLGGWERELEGC